jgi:hypothetical protein
MKLFLSFLLLTVFLSCSSPVKDGVQLYNNLYFITSEGELEDIITEETLAFYDENFNNSSPQKPIYKNIHHKDYNLYIGIPIRTTFEKLSAQKQTVRDSIIEINFCDTIHYVKSYSNDAIFVELTRKLEPNSLIYIAAYTKNSALADSLLTQTKLSNRLLQK